eukprot:TRINITY_DN74312_c0_g1_i1.p1 TRINITY_DN74312_c0_g1~~TRINITY_DN74312_c0_g1_i1.p1  ORF type:complete len:372 (-),score=55.85 TRINITY_DN74312_c0_g1_i1:104-1192(-)
MAPAALAEIAGDFGLLTLALAGAELADWCALELSARWARSAVSCVHPFLREAVCARATRTDTASTLKPWQLCQKARADCGDSDVTALWALLGDSAGDGETSPDGDSLLHLALAATGSGAPRLVAFLLSRLGRAAAPLPTNLRGQTALHLCARHGRTKPARRMLLQQQGVDVDAKDVYGATPLMEAVRQEQPGVARALLARRANPNTFVANCHGHGDTPLILAVRLQNVAIVQLLLAAPSIDLHQKSMVGCPFGKEALDFAPSTGELRKLLEEAIAHEKVEVDFGSTHSTLMNSPCHTDSTRSERTNSVATIISEDLAAKAAVDRNRKFEAFGCGVIACLDLAADVIDRWSKAVLNHRSSFAC